MSKKLIEWNVSNMEDEPIEEMDDSMLPKDPPGYVPAPSQSFGVEFDSNLQMINNEEQEEIDDTEILANARLRLEQGRLYEMLMTSNIFDNLDADEQAIKNVQREIKRFAKDRMEVMLGMKKPAEVSSSGITQFNDLEVKVLKSIADKMTGGVSQAMQSKNSTLSPISNGKVKAKETVKNIGKPVKQPQAPKQPIEVSPELANKKIEDMTYDEKLEYNRQKAATYNARKASNPDRIPMPDVDGTNAIATSKALNLNVVSNSLLGKR